MLLMIVVSAFQMPFWTAFGSEQTRRYSYAISMTLMHTYTSGMRIFSVVHDIYIVLYTDICIYVLDL